MELEKTKEGTLPETNKYTFTHEFESEITGDKVKLTYETETTTWSELLHEFRDFLKGCGFILEDE